MNWLKRNPKKTLLALNLVILLIAIIGFEAYLAGTGNYDTAFDKRYIRLREPVPNSRIKDTTLPPHSVMRVDENGFIEPARVHEDPDLQIVFLGGSTTECLIVEEEKRFPCLTGRALEQQTSLKVNAINCGCRGNHTAHSINNLFNKILPLKPDYVVMMHNINDAVLLAYMGTYWNDHFTRGMIVKEHYSFLETVRQLMVNTVPNIYGFLKQRQWLDLDALIHGQREDEWAMQREQQKEIDPKELQKMFAANLRTFVMICRNYDITPILMTQPCNPEEEASMINQIRIADLHRDFNTIIRYIAREEGVHLIDLAKDITDPQFFLDFVHFNNYGSTQVAKVITHNFLALLKKK
ncbi:MAG: SGNH/GDSL hydrolase family protein [Planctomycetota bacterium]